MAHAQKPDFVFRRNGRVHLKRRGRQFSRLLAAEVRASAAVMLDTPRSEIEWEYWLPTPFASFPFTSPPVRHRVPSHFKWPLHLSGNAQYRHVRIPCILFEWNAYSYSFLAASFFRTFGAANSVAHPLLVLRTSFVCSWYTHYTRGNSVGTLQTDTATSAVLCETCSQCGVDDDAGFLGWQCV
jgi:hypothetical protein